MIPERDPETNQLLLAAMVDELERYLASDELSRRLVVDADGKRHTATMTLGVMLHLITLLERDAMSMLPAERERLDETVSRFEAIRHVQPRQYGEKVQRELKSHLDSWAWFLDDCEEGEDSCFDNYADEVWLRTRIHQVITHAREIGLDVGEADKRLAELDAKLETVFQFGDYIGPPGEEHVYRRDVFWWLHGRPIREEDYY